MSEDVQKNGHFLSQVISCFPIQIKTFQLKLQTGGVAGVSPARRGSGRHACVAEARGSLSPPTFISEDKKALSPSLHFYRLKNVKFHTFIALKVFINTKIML